jgi:phosphohistidine phosphatase
VSGLRLYLMRHAKSSWDDPGTADFDRPLNERGRRAAAEMGALMAAKGYVPDRILCSNATRAQQTLAGVLGELPTTPEIIHTRGIYEADTARLLQLIRTSGSASAALMMIGHNPGIGELAQELAGGGNLAAVGRVQAKFATAALAVLSFTGSRWEEISRGAGRLDAFHTPARHGGD